MTPKPRTVPSAIKIDRQAHFEETWRRQLEHDRLMEAFSLESAARQVSDVPSQQFFDHVAAVAGPRIVVVFFYTRSCGSCKLIRQQLRQVAASEAAQGSGVLFLEHNIRSEFDDLTDLATQFRMRHAPCFGFFVEGALVKKMNVWDVRDLKGNTQSIQGQLKRDLGRLQRSIREMVFTNAPSARR